MININGIAHVMLNVTRWGECCDFYCSLLPFLGMKKVFEGEETIYFVGGRTGIGINKVENNDEMFDQKKLDCTICVFEREKLRMLTRYLSFSKIMEIRSFILQKKELGPPVIIQCFLKTLLVLV